MLVNYTSKELDLTARTMRAEALKKLELLPKLYTNLINFLGLKTLYLMELLLL